MGELRCVDGSVLSVQAVACRDSVGRPYEITLSLVRNSQPFAAVGQRCGHQLAQLAERVSLARDDPEQAAVWPDPDDRFPAPGSSAGPGCLSGDHEYFALRSRDRDDLPGTGELRCVLRSRADWMGECTGTGHRIPGQHRPARRRSPHPAADGHGGWRLSRRAVIEAWGSGGVGVRCVLTSGELVAFLGTVLGEAASADPAADARAAEVLTGSAREAGALEGQATGRRPAGRTMPLRRQQERVPDGIAWPCLPAVRAKARSQAGTAGDTAPRRGDVRW